MRAGPCKKEGATRRVPREVMSAVEVRLVLVPTWSSSASMARTLKWRRSRTLCTRQDRAIFPGLNEPFAGSRQATCFQGNHRYRA